MLIQLIKGTLIIFILACSSLSYSATSKKLVKIAILDNFHFQPNITNEYDRHYLAGVEVARNYAERNGYKIQYKVFRFSRKPLSIFGAISILNMWNPDVIIGPRNSNMFLLIKDSFKNILVLSPCATASEVEAMPKNYYSLSLPDRYMATALSWYITRHYPGRNIYSIVEADCKNCVDVSREIKELYKTKHMPKVIEHFYLQDSVKYIDLRELLKEYKDGDVILLPNTAYSSSVLMVRITNYLKRPMFYIGGDDWGNWKNTQIGKLRADFPYYGVNVTPKSLEITIKIESSYVENYRKTYHKNPDDVAGFIAYKTIESIIEALKQYDVDDREIIKSKILKCYLRALNQNKHWYKSNAYYFYRVDRDGGLLVETMKVPY